MRSAYLEENSGYTDGHLKKVEEIKVARTLTQVDSGKIFTLSSAGGAFTITLPTASNGVDGIYYEFFVEEETPTAAITFAAGSAIVSLVLKDAGGNASNSTVGTQISNIIVGTSAQKGDWIKLVYYSNEWNAIALSGIDDAITTS
jgi:hypothetical protein|tara:strand:+ start:4633 stop:5067 length:435 start_codon:yes stop_codon:yes gene_type:complete